MTASCNNAPLILLAGPTGVGKTELSLELASRLGTEIVNADSMQVYRFMDIGTAKPTAAERARVAHHLLDVADPDEAFDAAKYHDLARPIADGLLKAGKTPLVVGGTGLYMKVLTRGLCEGAPGDSNLRQALFGEEEARGLPALYGELAEVDPAAAGRIHPNDRQRILRALEVYRLTGASLSHWQDQHRFCREHYRTIKVFLYREREDLYRRIDRRVHLMMEQGLIEEVRRLMEMGYGPELKAMQSLGYKQLMAYLRGECRLDDAILQIQQETRRYAKRQMTWFRGDPAFHWLDADERGKILQWVEAALEESNNEKSGGDP